ncbi:MAG: hypothetical protein IPK53_09435 [bacterium]|nr:hypothetical protein [bacterium]
MAQWQLKGEDGTAVSFTTETTRLEPDKRIAWNTPTGDVKTSGQITFTPLPHDETEITISLRRSWGRRQWAGQRLPIRPQRPINAHPAQLQSLRRRHARTYPLTLAPTAVYTAVAHTI